MPFLYGDSLKCTGCRICELYCAFIRERVLNPKKARVRIVRREPAIDKPIACRQCADPACARVCPAGAIARDEKRELVVLNEAKCTGCGACVEACPFGAIWLHPDRKRAIKCDLCGACLRHCPVNALEILTSEELASRKRADLVERWEPILLGRSQVPVK